MTIKAKKSKINLREKLAELLNFRQIRDRLDGLGLYLGKDRTGTSENLAVRGGANIDDLQLAEISAALGGTAVDVFVYDTRNDSDGGKWRERTQHTSWYNEELNTATRGGRREFPAVAVIVAETNKVTIYDGDDPDLSMWMVFNQINYNGSSNTSCVAFLNGILVFGRNVGFPVWNFIKDREGIRTDSSLIYQTNVSLRNEASNGSILTTAGSPSIINNNINDVAMTVLPNAPIDSDTGLPIPTIAVATDGGVSVIKDDGSVVDKGTTSAAVNQVQWMGSGRLVATAPAYYGVFDDPFMEESAAFLGYISDSVYNQDYTKNHLYQVPNLMAQLDANSKLLTLDTRTIIASTSAGLNVHEMGEGAAANNNHGIATYITSKYNTGWMPGDIKLATLSDTKNETVGVDETTELVTNGGFNSDYTGWYGEDANLTNANHPDSGSNSLLVTPTASLGKAMQDVTTVSGQKYVLSADIAFGAGCTKITIADNSGVVINEDYFPADGNRTVAIDFDGDARMSSLKFAVYGGPAYFDNVSIKQTGELITNGTFDDGTTGWTEGNGASLSVNASKQLVVTNGVYGFAQQNLSGLTIGKKYVFSYDVIMGTSNEARAYVRKGDGTTEYLANHHTSDASGSITFIATQTDHPVRLLTYSPNNGETSIWDNVSVRLAEDDRSVNNNGLQVFGEITKSPVAPGADLVAYSGFSADDYLMQPYNSDLDFGTGDFCIMFWQKSTTHSGQEVFFDIGENGVFDNRYMFYRSSGTAGIQFWKRVNGVSTVILDVFDVLRVGAYHFIVGTRKDGVFTFYVNGRNVGSVADSSDLTFSGLNRTCIVGNSVSGSSPVQNMALFRISATAPTAEQIAKIYRDEKVLFQDGAQATLYGTSDAVTALAYDDKTELLHVGTSGGRSDFSGLRRINNTTTAVTTSISASNNLIAEQ